MLAPAATAAAVTLRRSHQGLIAQNSMVITISRKGRVRDEATGGFTPVNATIGPLTVRIVRGVPSDARFRTAVPGTQQRDTDWLLLAPHDADLRAGSEVTDRFTDTLLGTFRIQDVTPLSAFGHVYGVQAALAREG